jgi:hypothetical protein
MTAVEAVFRMKNPQGRMIRERDTIDPGVVT